MKSARNADISPHSLRFNKERQRVNDCSNQTRTGSRLLSPINVRSYPFDRFSRGSGDGFPSEGEKKETPPPSFLFASSFQRASFEKGQRTFERAASEFIKTFAGPDARRSKHSSRCFIGRLAGREIARG